jgi:hypothetical protein
MLHAHQINRYAVDFWQWRNKNFGFVSPFAPLPTLHETRVPSALDNGNSATMITPADGSQPLIALCFAHAHQTMPVRREKLGWIPIRILSL